MQKIGKYEILERIGSGGFGVVFKGRDPFIKRHVAIKTCASGDEEIRRRFFREAEIAGNLQHRNVTTVYDFGFEGDVPYLVQEYLPGEDLDQLIARRCLSAEQKLDYLIQIAAGLAYAHEQGVIHRDIKPSNVRVVEGTRVKIMDFGIAKLAHLESQLTKTGMTLGTASYLAPEQIQGGELTTAADIFSFGVLAYELFANRRPFESQSLSNLFYQILTVEPPPLRDLDPSCSPALAAVIERCLAKDPAARWPSCAALQAALEPLRGSLGGVPDDRRTAAMPQVRDGEPERTPPRGATAAGDPALRESAGREEAARVAARVEALLAAGDAAAADIEVTLARKRLAASPAALQALAPLVERIAEERLRREALQRRAERMDALLARARELAEGGAHQDAVPVLLAALEIDEAHLPARQMLAREQAAVLEQERAAERAVELERQREAARRAEEERRRQAEEARRAAEERRRAEAAERARQEEERRRAAEAERQAAAERKRREQEERQRAAAEKRRLAEEKKAAAEEARRVEAERRRVEAAQREAEEQRRKAEEAQRRAAERQRKAAAEQERKAEAEREQAAVEERRRAEERSRQAALEERRRRSVATPLGVSGGATSAAAPAAARPPVRARTLVAAAAVAVVVVGVAVVLAMRRGPAHGGATAVGAAGAGTTAAADLGSEGGAGDTGVAAAPAPPAGPPPVPVAVVTERTPAGAPPLAAAVPSPAHEVAPPAVPRSTSASAAPSSAARDGGAPPSSTARPAAAAAPAASSPPRPQATTPGARAPASPPQAPPPPAPRVEPARTPEPRSETPASPRTEPAAERPAPRAAGDDTAGVREAIARYQSAFERLDAAAVQAVLPSVDVSRLRRSFESYDSLSMTLAGCAVQAQGATATADCERRQEVHPKAGKALSNSQRVRVRLHRAGDGWLIDAIDPL